VKLKEQLQKLGLRVRTRPNADGTDKPGKIVFDEKGNAILDWGDESLKADGETGERLRSRALAHPGLAIADDDPLPNAPIRPNPKGLRVGYNPYESGMLAKKEHKKKVDLEELSKVLELKRKMKDKKD
jgi:hypothetical protein